MMNSRKLLAANWKMHLNLAGAQSLTQELIERLAAPRVPVVLCTPFPYLHPLHQLIQGHPGFHLGAQNLHQEKQGAFTGETSGEMLASVGAEYVIVGHSERRTYYQESSDLLSNKLIRARQAGLKPIFCIGESLQERERGVEKEVITRQLLFGCYNLLAENFAHTTIAYEPVWAIGTGRTATAEQAQEMHAFIREKITERYGDNLAQETTILYGGSVKASNANELFAQPDVDGGLIGGASLDAAEFADIYQALLNA
ncbi:MAG: triose-phosphate isomerase [Bacteroidetes bacterium]|jgi:triosephosphate isomerase|nr:triose-phosphate isomerase [Bacteroidota bacterium]